MIAPDQVVSATIEGPLRVVERIASEGDVQAWEQQRERAKEDTSRAQALAARSDPGVRVASLTYDLSGERGELTVNIFADWNKDGDWDDADGCTDEWALQNFALDVSGEPDFTILAVDFPGGDQVDEFWMRVTLTDQAYDPATGNLLPGETEDYLISGGQVFQPDEPAQPSGPGKTAFPEFD